MKIAYFGGEPIGVPVLEELRANGITPDLVVCSPDRRSGRKLELTPPPVKVWAEAEKIEVFQPDTLKDKATLAPLTEGNFDLFVVVAYNHIMPEWLIDLPKYKTINVHPSLLPLYRGPSPIRTAILEDNCEAIGVSIMLMDKEMDHGPILDQEALPITDKEWPVDGSELDEALARLGGSMLATTISEWVAGNIEPQEQAHTAATYTKKYTKSDGELALDPHSLPGGEAARQALLKIKAFSGWPGTFFFHNNKRIKITDASLDAAGNLIVNKVVPEGKDKMDFTDWKKSLER